jgi:uncharacterized surface protein with fasciclin (FAS1) repeats
VKNSRMLTSNHDWLCSHFSPFFLMADTLKTSEIPTIVGAARSTPSLSTLFKALQSAELVDTYEKDGSYTVFAPNNDAFAKLPSADLTTLMTPDKKSDLIKILNNHIVKWALKSTDLKEWTDLTSLQGSKLKVTIKDKKFYINGALVTLADITVKNGIVHVIDTVLMV